MEEVLAYATSADNNSCSKRGVGGGGGGRVVSIRTIHWRRSVRRQQPNDSLTSTPEESIRHSPTPPQASTARAHLSAFFANNISSSRSNSRRSSIAEAAAGRPTCILTSRYEFQTTSLCPRETGASQFATVVGFSDAFHQSSQQAFGTLQRCFPASSNIRSRTRLAIGKRFMHYPSFTRTLVMRRHLTHCQMATPNVRFTSCTAWQLIVI